MSDDLKSRSVQRREALQKGEKMPTFEGQGFDEDKFERVCDLCGASFTGPKHQCAASNMQPPEVSHYKYRAGRGYLEPVMQPSDAEQPELSSNLQDNTLETNRKLRFALDNLRAELRELEVKWRSPEWARTHISDDRPSEFICADELHAVLAPIPRPAEKD